jgi:hypothetical protein
MLALAENWLKIAELGTNFGGIQRQNGISR